MSDLLVMSFDCVSSPTLTLKLEGTEPKFSGWGVGWYPNDDTAATVVKDSGAKGVETLTSTLSDWKRFRSTTYLCKIKGAAKRYSQQDTQPFQRSYGGRDWLFIHNGTLDRDALDQLLGEGRGSFEPMGTTDSETLFCAILWELKKSQTKRIADLNWSTCQRWLEKLTASGTANLVLSDGQSTLVYQGKNTDSPLYFLRRCPPHSEMELGGDSITLSLGDAMDTYRTALLLSSTAFSPEWSEMQPNHLMIVRRGSIQWDSLGSAQSAAEPSPQDIRPMTQESTPFGSAQTAQSLSGPTITNIKSIVRAPDGAPLQYRSYKVTHTTEYGYSKPVERSSHLLRLKPVEDQLQEVVFSTLSVSVGGEQVPFQDVFGNDAIYMNLEQPYTTLEVKGESEVRVYAQPPDDFTPEIRRTSIPLVWMPWQRQMMMPYLLPHELPESQLLELTRYAMGFVEKCDYHLIDTITEMNNQIFKDYTYAPGSTTVKTTAFEVYSNRRGVCQDFANLLICLTRLLNIPSRYRVGYIYTGGNYENKIQSDASHAWVEVYLPYVGWRGFDPTNGTTVGQDHIRVACGRNFSDATPTMGTLYKGGGTESLSVSVKVEPSTTQS